MPIKTHRQEVARIYILCWMNYVWQYSNMFKVYFRQRCFTFTQQFKVGIKTTVSLSMDVRTAQPQFFTCAVFQCIQVTSIASINCISLEVQCESKTTLPTDWFLFKPANDLIDCGATDSHNSRLSHIFSRGKLDNPSFFIRVVPLHVYICMGNVS